jgi:hypothetical protein
MPPVARKILYWVAVLAVSVALLVGLVLLLESLDSSSVDNAGAATSTQPT